MNKLKEWAQGKDNTSEWLKTIINSMWIPCSEMLPSENDEYIITMGKDSFNKEGHVTWAMFDKLKKKFYFPGGRVNYYITVTAWMPRPKPYIKEVDDENDVPQTDSEITRNSLRSDCTGCRFVGWYDTEFPCVNCIRKNKDYYDSE